MVPMASMIRTSHLVARHVESRAGELTRLLESFLEARH